MKTETTELSYDERRAIEEAENKKLGLRLSNILITMGFKIAKKEEHTPSVTGTKGDMTLYLRANEYQNKGKLSVNGSYPRDSKGDYIYFYLNNEKSISINITLSKTDEQIIKDINNRFIPKYTINLKECLEKISASNNATETRNNFIHELGKILAIKPYYSSSSNTYPSLNEYEYTKKIRNLKVTTNYHGNEATIEISLEKNLALKLATFIQRLEKENQ